MGQRCDSEVFFPSIRSVRQLAMVERMCASPGMVRATAESVFRIDVRPILPTITAPTLVIHARDDLVPVQYGRYLADHIPGARYLEVDGAAHAPWFTEPDTILTRSRSSSPAAMPRRRSPIGPCAPCCSPTSSRRRNTPRRAGDERWRAVLHRFGEITTELTQRFGGTVVKSTGDGHLATFDGPTQAIRCAEALRAEAETLGIEIRAGIHTGECELLDADIGGIAVHIAARISAMRAPVKSSSRAPCVTWSSARARASRTAAASSCVACPAPGNCWRSIAMARGRDRLRRNWRQCPLLAVGPRCAARTAPWRRSGGAHRGFSAGWPASPQPPAAAEQPESARFDTRSSMIEIR